MTDKEQSKKTKKDIRLTKTLIIIFLALFGACSLGAAMWLFATGSWTNATILVVVVLVGGLGTLIWPEKKK